MRKRRRDDASPLISSLYTAGYAYDCCSLAVQFYTFDVGVRHENRIVFSFRLNGIDGGDFSGAAVAGAGQRKAAFAARWARRPGRGEPASELFPGADAVLTELGRQPMPDEGGRLHVRRAAAREVEAVSEEASERAQRLPRQIGVQDFDLVVVEHRESRSR